MKDLIIKIARIVLSLWKPDFRKTTGWLFITTGLVTLAPPFVHSLILNMLGLLDIAIVDSLDNTDTLGALMVCIGVLFHLFFMADKPEHRAAETVLGALIILYCALLVVYTL